MRKILLINPSGISLGLNVGLSYLAAILKKNGSEVKIIDFLNQPGDEDRRLSIAKDYDIIGISIKTLVIDESLRIIRKVKKINNKAIIICGGVHISLDGYDFMKTNKNFDIAFMNDCEDSIIDYIKCRKIEDISGVIYRKYGKIIINQKKESKLSLDELPFPDFDSFDMPLHMINNYPLVTSRGCPYNCIYCPVQVVGKKWKARSVEGLILELKKVRPRIKEFHIVDDNFTLDMNRVKKFCRRLVEEKLNLRWSCPNGIRADKLDEELVKLMKKSGCYLVNLGIESAEETVFNNIKKGESLEDIKRAIKLLKEGGINVFGNFIIGLPASTFKSDMESLRNSKKLGLDISFWYPLSLYPKTEAYSLLLKDPNFKFIDDWKKGFKYDFSNEPTFSFEYNNYTKKEMKRIFFIANLRSGAYGILLDPKKSLFKRGFSLFSIIFKYDPLYFFYHTLNAFIVLIYYKKRY